MGHFPVWGSAVTHHAVLSECLPVVGRHCDPGVLAPRLIQQPVEEDLQIPIRIQYLAIIDVTDVLKIGRRQIAGIPVDGLATQLAAVGEPAQVTSVETLEAVTPPLEVVVDCVGVKQQEERLVNPRCQSFFDHRELLGKHPYVVGVPVPVEVCSEAELRPQETSADTPHCLIPGSTQLPLEGDRHRRPQQHERVRLRGRRGPSGSIPVDEAMG